MTSGDKPTLDLLAPAPIIFGVPFAIGVALHFLLDSIRLGLPVPVSLAAGAILLGLSLLIAAWSIRTMFRSGEHPDPRHATGALIDTGLFAYSRNPIYVSFVFGGAGIAIGINSVFMLAAVPIGAIAIDRLVIIKEEKYLEALFGDAYRQYASRVRRWL